MSDRQEENRQVVEKHVSNMLADMGDGELAVVYEVCNRLALGRQRYGSIDRSAVATGARTSARSCSTP